ncbi:MAG TPA: hypothetical protein DCX03_07380 [Bacteroidales bacterium]|nr:hypothetical protein [Bacteroidales bacterium]
MSSYTEALISLSDVTYEIGIDACSDRSELRKEVEDLRKVIEGNGDPTHSVINRLASVEKAVDSVASNVQEIKDKLIGTLEKGGIIPDNEARFKRLEDLHNDIKKVVWYVVLAWLGIIINVIVGLL